MKAVDAKLTQIVETSCCSTNYLTRMCESTILYICRLQRTVFVSHDAFQTREVGQASVFLRSTTP